MELSHLKKKKTDAIDKMVPQVGKINFGLKLAF